MLGQVLVQIRQCMTAHRQKTVLRSQFKLVQNHTGVVIISLGGREMHCDVDRKWFKQVMFTCVLLLMKLKAWWSNKHIPQWTDTGLQKEQWVVQRTKIYIERGINTAFMQLSMEFSMKRKAKLFQFGFFFHNDLHFLGLSQTGSDITSR